MAIDTDKMTVDLLVVRGFADGQPVFYLSFGDSDAGSAVIERATFTPWTEHVAVSQRRQGPVEIGARGALHVRQRPDP